MYQAIKNITLTRKHILASPPKNKQTNKRTKSRTLFSQSVMQAAWPHSLSLKKKKRKKKGGRIVFTSHTISYSEMYEQQLFSIHYFLFFRLRDYIIYMI